MDKIIMNPAIKHLALSTILAAITLSSSAFAADDKKIRIGTEGAYAPWNFLNDDGKLVGFEIDLGNELCKRTESTCEFVTNEWDSIMPNLVAGNYDAIMAGMSVTEERKKTIAFSAEYYPPDPSRYVTTKDTKLNFDALEGKNVGVQGATIQAAYAEEKLSGKNTIKSYEKPDQSIADLMAGNIDLILADGAYLEPIVKGTKGQIVFTGPDVAIGGGVAIGLRQNDEDLQKQLNGALDAMKKDGTLDQMIKKYFDKGPFFSEATDASDDKEEKSSEKSESSE